MPKKPTELEQDEIVAEIRRHRDEHAKSFNYDLDAIYEDLKKSEQESGQQLVNRPPRRPHRPARAA
jgi:hypothetical protein